MKNIVYSCDNCYARQTVISIVSLLMHNNYPLKIWIISDHISEKNKEFIKKWVLAYKGEIEFLEAETILSGVQLSIRSRHPRTIYAKLFLEHSIIDCDKLLYLDSDTIIMGDLETIWERDMNQELVAGVQMPYSKKTKDKMTISNNAPYICDGIVLLNLSMWRKYNIGEKCRKYIETCNGFPPMLSEGTLNYVCQGYTGILDPRFNLMPAMIVYSSEQIKKLFNASFYYNEAELEMARNKPLIIHFINELFNRPWFEPCDHPYKDEYRKVDEKIFGGVTQYEYKDISKNTRKTKKMYRILPFRLFCMLYHMKHKIIN